MTGQPHCVPAAVAAGLANRSDAILQRENDRIPAYGQRLQGGGGKGEPLEGPAPIPVDAIISALENRDPRTLGVAGFLAGRCQVDDTAASHRLDDVLRSLVEIEPRQLDLLSEGFVESAMALALRGAADTGHQALTRYLKEGDEGFAGWLAAAYLAELGDPGGWPVLRRCLREGIDHVRLMAARQLLMFVPFDGQTVDGQPIDIAAEMHHLTDDPSEWVRHEVPGLVSEAGLA